MPEVAPDATLRGTLIDRMTGAGTEEKVPFTALRHCEGMTGYPRKPLGAVIQDSVELYLLSPGGLGRPAQHWRPPQPPPLSPTCML